MPVRTSRNKMSWSGQRPPYTLNPGVHPPGIEHALRIETRLHPPRQCGDAGFLNCRLIGEHWPPARLLESLVIGLRRLIEDTTDDMLDVLIEALQDEEGADPALIEQIKKAKEGKSFEDKVRYAVNVLPPHLRPSGIDPFALLFDVYSEDLHSSSEEECLETADAMRDVLDIIFRQLKTQVKERKVAAEKLKALQARHAQPKRGAPQ